jgi:hypothetical protein
MLCRMWSRCALVVSVIVAGLVFGSLAVPVGAATSSADQAIAQAGVLVAGDFPSGWVQKPHDSSGDAATAKAAAKISSCKQFAAFTKANKKNPRAVSPDFDLGQASVSNTVALFSSAQSATAALAAFRNSSVAPCLNSLFSVLLKAQLAKDKTVGSQIKSIKSQVALASGVQGGDEAVAYEGPVVVTLKNGQATTIDVGYATIRDGRAVNGYSYTTDSDISTVLTNAVNSSNNRLVAALAAPA